MRFVKETWLPTVVFAGLSVLVATADLPKIHYLPLITALTIVPFVWKTWVMRHGRPRVGRAALAGAASAFMIWLWSTYMVYGLLGLAHPPNNRAWEGLGFVFLLGTEFIGGPFGAVVGIAAAFVQAHVWPTAHQEFEEDLATWDGAVGGALIATLIAPLAAFVAATALGGDITIFALWTWLVLTPVNAFLGVKAVRRWRRIHGEV
jgi:hypothetical protein